MKTGAGSASSSSATASSLAASSAAIFRCVTTGAAAFRRDFEAQQGRQGVDEGGGVEGFVHAASLCKFRAASSSGALAAKVPRGNPPCSIPAFTRLPWA